MLGSSGDFQSKVAGRRMEGTSFSAPVVSAAAALVKQAYPWMNAIALRQTILSTTKPNEDRNTYGWGVLDISKAVQGPALFDKQLTLGGNFIADLGIDKNAYTFNNDIAGNTDLLKTGTGSLTLSGTNTYTGDNQVEYGELNITGSVRAGVVVESFATLRADNGKIGDNINNSGTLIAAGKGMAIAGHDPIELGATMRK
ncbi:MAG: S8 family serine peptidase [Glaciimonas sp.]|nr:S8 family serine peptidase [Glaciimonas sp.]